ncbi:MAG: leucine-rich repeat protein [Bacteroidaceae bacterium]|nr:leucine-rich repeat protein [Bacteroidaceae bacterium]
MKRRFLKSLLSIACLLCSIGIQAHDFEVDGIYYNICSEEDKTVAVTSGTNNYTGNVIIQETVTYSGNTYSVTLIESFAFYDCTGLTSITIPNSVTSLGMWVFYGCTGLTEIRVEAITPLTIDSNTFEYVRKSIPLYVPAGCGEAYRSADYWSEFTNIQTQPSVQFVYNGKVLENGAVVEVTEFDEEQGVMPWHVEFKNNTSADVEVVMSYKSYENKYADLMGMGFGDGLSMCTSQAVSGVTATAPAFYVDAEGNPDCGTFHTSFMIMSNNKGFGGYQDAYIKADYMLVNKANEDDLTYVTVIFDYAKYVAAVNKAGVGGIYYQFIAENEVEVTYYGVDKSNVPDEYKYTGAVVIPETITYSGNTYSVTSIGDHAFSECTGLSEITIPNSITSIGDNAFRGCDGLTELWVEATTPPTILPNTFDGVYKSIPVYLPAGCGEAYQNAVYWNEFSKLIELEPEVVVPQIGDKITVDGIHYQLTAENEVAVTYYGDGRDNIPNKYKYSGTVAIPESVTYNESTYSVTSIGEEAFKGCTGLTEITIPNCVSTIGYSAFYYCTGLTEISIPNSVTKILDSAFYGCTGLTKIRVEASNPPYVGVWGFENVDKTIPVYVPIGCVDAYKSNYPWNEFYIITDRDIVGKKFESNDIFYQITAEDEVSVAQKGYSGSIVIPESVIYEDVTYRVTSIGPEAFNGCSELTAVTLPNSLTSIGNGAFSGCGRLAEITIPNSVTSIGSGAFLECSALKEITIPNGITTICSSTFAFCNLTSITIPSSVTTIDDSAFYGSVNKIYISDLAAWCNIVFANEYAYPNGSLYLNGELITDLVIPSNVTSIGNYAFYCCSQLSSVTIGNSVTSIGDNAFSGCTDLTEITIPNSVSTIGNYAFYCCSQLSSVTIGNSVTSIGNNAFYGCCNLTSINIPNSVTSIGTGAFNGCSELTAVTLPNSLTSIGRSAFYGCSGLKEIRVEGVIPPSVERYAFNGVDKSIPVYVPAESVETYKRTSGWSDFTNIQSIAEDNYLRSEEVIAVGYNGVMSQMPIPMNVELVNKAPISSIQCDVYLPEGLSIKNFAATLSNRATDNHTISVSKLSNGAIRILIMSMTAAAIEGNDGELFTLWLIANDNYNSESVITIRNIVMTDTDVIEYTPQDVVVKCSVRGSILGDANGDEKINVTDIVLLAKYILNDYNETFDTVAADVNQDGKINISDIVAIANMILWGDGAANAPAREEQTPGEMSMENAIIAQGSTTTIPLLLDNVASYTAFQMDVTLPQGLDIEDVAGSVRMESTHNLMWSEVADGIIRIIAFATNNSVIDGNEGELLSLTLRADNQFAGGEISVSEALFVTRGMTAHNLENIAVRVSAPSKLASNRESCRIYTTGSTIVIDSPVAQEVRVSSLDGVVKTVALQPGRNEIPMQQQGIYIVVVGYEAKKVVIK